VREQQHIREWAWTTKSKWKHTRNLREKKFCS